MVTASDVNAMILVLILTVPSIANVRLTTTIIRVERRWHRVKNSRNQDNVQELNRSVHDAINLNVTMTPIVMEMRNAAQLDALKSVLSQLIRPILSPIIHVSHSTRYKRQHSTKCPKRICDLSHVKVALQLFVASRLASHHPLSHGNEAESKLVYHFALPNEMFIEIHNSPLLSSHKSLKQIRDALSSRRLAICKLCNFIEQMQVHMFVSHTMESAIALSAKCI